MQRLGARLNLNLSRKVNDLSFGNKKKVGIVSALQHNPRLLILDEPTSGLDPLMQHEFFCILKELNANGTTVFLSSHILSEVQNNCNRVAIIRDGPLPVLLSTLASGNVVDLNITEPSLEEIFMHYYE